MKALLLAFLGCGATFTAAAESPAKIPPALAARVQAYDAAQIKGDRAALEAAGR